MSAELTSQDQQMALEMLRVRYWQHIVNEDLKKKKFTVPIHCAIGHEALAVAVSRMMEPEDQLVLTHRNMAYNLARAGGLAQIYAEYQLSPSGPGKGRLGSMNLVCDSKGVAYSSSVLGNNIAVACGMALAKQVKSRPGLVIVFSGDGAMEEGSFYEGLVFSRTQRLGLLILVENNNMSMSSTISERRCGINMDKLCGSVGIPFHTFRGNDLFEYAPTLKQIRRSILEQQTPVCVEAHLGSINQHAGPTPGWPTDPKNISLERGLIVEQSDRDPLFVLKQRLGEPSFENLSSQVLSEPWGG
ncbi:MAG: hypothetical protein HY211_06015 [Candidatus Omnitrophica bacterium]|nr:hypothetical protein [Candidatus Omnitrophota bacterium]